MCSQPFPDFKQHEVTPPHTLPRPPDSVFPLAEGLKVSSNGQNEAADKQKDMLKRISRTLMEKLSVCVCVSVCLCVRARTGEVYNEPRLTCWFGELPYTYSRSTLAANTQVLFTSSLFLSCKKSFGDLVSGFEQEDVSALLPVCVSVAPPAGECWRGGGEA